VDASVGPFLTCATTARGTARTAPQERHVREVIQERFRQINLCKDHILSVPNLDATATPLGLSTVQGGGGEAWESGQSG
jgi:hypothetical protein